MNNLASLLGSNKRPYISIHVFFPFVHIEGSNRLACRAKEESCLGSFSQLSGLLWPVVMLSLPGLSNK